MFLPTVPVHHTPILLHLRQTAIFVLLSPCFLPVYSENEALFSPGQKEKSLKEAIYELSAPLKSVL